MALFDWINPGRLLGLSLWGPEFLLACAPSAILCCLALSKRWARFTDPPYVFALVYGVPFFLLTFQDSLGDSLTVMGNVRLRYQMSEPGATWIHYWLYRLLHEQFNVGAKFVIALSSRLCGVAYLWAVARISIELFPTLSPSRRLVYRLLFYTAGMALLFYGYVEDTPPTLPSEQLWVLTTILFLRTPSFANLFKCSAALALATAFHGRVSFLAPALLLGCWIPPGSFAMRIKRTAFSGMVYFGLLALMVAYIILVEPNYIAGGLYGNVFGGGNMRMFVPLNLILTRDHWYPIVASLFIAGGVLVLCGLLLPVGALFRRDRFVLWVPAYVLSDMFYVFFWEFDFGPDIDWDLIFPAAGPLLLLASIAATRSRVPMVALVPCFLANIIMSMVFATIINFGHPLALNIAPRAGAPAADSVCAQSGLRRTYFSDSQLTMPSGPSETDVPNHEYSPGVYSPGKALGGVFEGYIRIPSKGRYRFSVLGTGNLRFSVANQMLFEHWTGFEWQILPERELQFSEAGWYPLRFEFFTTVGSFRTELYLESAGNPTRKISADDLCHG